MKTIKTSIYSSFKSSENIDVELVLIFKRIKSDYYREKIIYMRSVINTPDEYSKLKQKLPCFMVSGTFNQTKTKSNLNKYSQVIHLDYDKIAENLISTVKKKACSLPTTLACFISPSGKGLKIFIKTDSTVEEHDEVYKEISILYDKLLGIYSDLSCSNINRACFVSWDRELYLNMDSAPYIRKKQHIDIQNAKPYSMKSVFECIEFTKNVCQYVEGNRNNFIYRLARNANKWGIDMDEVINISIAQFDLEENEIRTTITNAFENNKNDFAKSAEFAKFAKLQQNDEKEKETIIESPYIPNEVYQKLPELLKEASSKFNVRRQKDVFLTSALAVLSGCLPHVEGVYGKKTMYPNIFTMILAPASSGKSVMNFSIDLCRYHHTILLEQSKSQKKNYESELLNYNQAKDKSKLTIPEKPKRKSLIIPGNSSSSSIYRILDGNEGRGIMIETEADTVGNVLKSEWGSFSELLRKAHENERLSQSRITSDLFIEIEKPKLSVVLSGTPNQIFNIMANAEDGLVSRFIFYYFEGSRKWRSQRPSESDLNINKYFKRQGEKVHSMIEFFKTNSVKFKFNEKQWSKHDYIFKTYSEKIIKQFGQESVSIVNRMGQIHYRISMMLTAIRIFEANFKQKVIDCYDDDFESATLLIETYIQHSLIVFKNLPSSSKNNFKKPDTNFDLVLEQLNSEFKRSDAVSIGKTFNLASRTVDEKLKKYVDDNLLRKQKAGTYEKLDKN